MQNRKIIKVLFLAYSSLLLLGLCDNLRGPLYPEILKQFSVADMKGSLFFAFSSGFGVLGAFFSRYLISHLSLVKALQISIFLMLFSLGIFGFAPNFDVILFGSIFFGFSMGVMAVVQNMLVVKEVPTGPLKTKVINGLHSMYAGSSLGAPLLITMVAASPFVGEVWRGSFLLSAILAAILLGFSFLGPRYESLERPQKLEDLENGERKSSRLSEQIYFGIILSSYVLAEVLVSTRIALYIRREFGGSLEDSNFYTGGFFVMLLMSRVLFAIWSPKLKTEMQMRGSLILSGISLLFGIFVHPIGLAVSAFFMGPFYPLMMFRIGEVFPTQIREAISWAVTLSSIFLVFMHFSAGVLTQILSVKMAFFLGPIFLVVAFLMLVMYETIFRRV